MTTTLLHLDSRHRTNQSDKDGGKSLFHLITPLRNVSCVELLSASIPVSWYTVVSGKNTFTLTQGGTDSIVTIVPGQYTMTTLAQAVASAINLTDFTVTTHAATLRIVFQYNAAFSVSIPTEELSFVLGFGGSAVNKPHASVTNALTSPYIPELITPYISIGIRQFGSGFASGTGREVPALFMVPVDQVFGGNLNYNSESHFKQVKKTCTGR